MSSWIDTLDDNHFLRTLFPAEAPALDPIRLHEVQLHQDGPAVSLRFDLQAYPQQPPAKWQTARSNTVQVRLVGIGVREMAIRGWSRNNVGRLVLNGPVNGIVVEFDAAGCRISGVFDRLRVDSVSAYRDAHREGG